jgi:hypothetical protein
MFDEGMAGFLLEKMKMTTTKIECPTNPQEICEKYKMSMKEFERLRKRIRECKLSDILFHFVNDEMRDIFLYDVGNS